MRFNGKHRDGICDSENCEKDKKLSETIFFKDLIKNIYTFDMNFLVGKLELYGDRLHSLVEL